jgi:hypothetical protein
MPSLPRRPVCPGARPCPGRSSLDRTCAPGVTWQLSQSEDRHDQLNHSVHALRGTPQLRHRGRVLFAGGTSVNGPGGGAASSASARRCPGGRLSEQAPGFRDGERDHPELGGRGLVWQCGDGCGGAGAAAQQGGGDGADGQGRRDQHGMPGDGGVEADLRLVEPETVLSELEIFFGRPAQPGRADRPGRGRRLSFGQVAVAEGELAGGQVAADQQVVPRGGGAQPRPGVPALSFRSRPGGADLQPRRPPSCAAACLQVSVIPLAKVRRKLDGTRST